MSTRESWSPPLVRSTTDLAIVNRAAVVQSLIEGGPQSRADLARVVGVPRGTIGGIVQSLLDDGTLTELAPVPLPGRGKPSRPLWFSDAAALSGAASIREGEVEAGVVNARGDVLARIVRAYPASASQGDIVAAVIDALRDVIASVPERTVGIGIAVPGLCDPSGRVVERCTPIPVLQGCHLAEQVEAGLGLPVRIDEDSRTIALGEQWFGSGRAIGDFAAIQIGEGIGAGVILDGRLFPRDGRGTEAGHTCVDQRGELCRCGKRGCWETVASRRWLRARTESVPLPAEGGALVEAFRSAADVGDERARDVLDEYAENVGLGLANLSLLLGVPTFILHGDAMAGGEELRSRVERALRRHLQPNDDEGVTVLLADESERIRLLGAGSVMMRQHFGMTDGAHARAGALAPPLPAP